MKVLSATLKKIASVTPLLLPWMAGPLLIHVPESKLLVETILTQQFWFLFFNATSFGLISVILQGIYTSKIGKQAGFLNSLIFIVTLVVIAGGYLLGFEAIRTRVGENIFYLIAVLSLSIIVSQICKQRKFLDGIVLGGFLSAYLAAVLSIIIFSGSILWPSWIVGISLALPTLCLFSYQALYSKLVQASLVLLPLPIAWMVSLTILPITYLAVMILYLPIYSLLIRLQEERLENEVFEEQLGKISLIFVVLLVIVRVL